MESNTFLAKFASSPPAMVKQKRLRVPIGGTNFFDILKADKSKAEAREAYQSSERRVVAIEKVQEYQANVLEQTRKLAEKSGKVDTARQDKLKTNELLASAQMKARSLSASSLHHQPVPTRNNANIGIIDFYHHLENTQSADLSLVSLPSPFSPPGTAPGRNRTPQYQYTEKQQRQLLATGTEHFSEGLIHNGSIFSGPTLRTSQSMKQTRMQPIESFDPSDFTVRPGLGLASGSLSRARTKQCAVSMHSASLDNMLNITSLVRDGPDARSWDQQTEAQRYVTMQQLADQPDRYAALAHIERSQQLGHQRGRADRIRLEKMAAQQRTERTEQQAATQIEMSHARKAEQRSRYHEFIVARQEKDIDCASRKFRRGFGQFYSLPTYGTAPITDLPRGYDEYFAAANVPTNHPAPSPSQLPVHVRHCDIAASFLPSVDNQYTAVRSANHPLAQVEVPSMAVSPNIWHSPHAKAGINVRHIDLPQNYGQLISPPLEIHCLNRDPTPIRLRGTETSAGN